MSESLLPAPGARPRLMSRDFAAILVTQVCLGYAVASFQMLPKFLDVELGADASQIGLVTACFGVATVLVTPILGAWVDRFGRRRCLAFGAVLTALTSFAFVDVVALGPLVYVLRALQGAAFGIAFVAGSTLAVDRAPPERLAQALGLFGLTQLSMNAVGPVVTEELAGRVGWAAAFATAGAGAVACLALVLLVVREPEGVHAHGGNGASLLAVALRPRQLRLAAVNVLTAAACGVMFAFHQPFALALGIERVGSFFAAYACAAVLVRVGLGGFIDPLGRSQVARACLAVYAVVVTGMAGLGTLGLVPFGAVFGVAHGLLFPAFNAIVIEGVAPAERGKVMAIFIGAFNLGFAAGPFALGPLADARGFPAVFLAAGACTFAALAIFVASPESRAARAPLGPADAAAASPGALRRP